MENEAMVANMQSQGVADKDETCMATPDFSSEAEQGLTEEDMACAKSQYLASGDEPCDEEQYLASGDVSCDEARGLADGDAMRTGAQAPAGGYASCDEAQGLTDEGMACAKAQAPAGEAVMSEEGLPSKTVEDADSDEFYAHEELVSLLAQQAAGYELLGRLFQREVDVELLQSLCEGRYPAHTGNDHLDEGYRGLVVFLNHRGERTGTELNVDYLHVFIGNTQDASHVAYPYESVYTSPDHLLMQDARDAVLAAYRSEMITLVNEHNEPEDHMGFELAFCAVLLRRAVEALTAGNTARAIELVEKERAFVRDHLGVWAPEFAADVKRIAQTGFYRALADILLGYLEVDTATMEAVVVELGE